MTKVFKKFERDRQTDKGQDSSLRFKLNACFISLMRKTCKHLSFIKNVSSAISHQKNPSFRLSLWDFKKNFPNTFIYEQILIYKNANIMNTQIFHSVKYDSTVIEGHKTLTYVLMDTFFSLFYSIFAKQI